MARKNRIVINNGVYHVTTRIANQELLFKDDELKSNIVQWMYDVADFSGVNMLAWCIMENHLHIFFNVPDVPQQYWLNQNNPPSPTFFSVRPSACTPPRWYPTGDSPTTFGDSPTEMEKVAPRPPVEFMLSDEEMLERLTYLYGTKVVEQKEKAWRKKRLSGRGGEVDDEKERYCRRMYNVSQFVKTLKERIAMRYNADKRNHHSGCLFQGRFYSAIVEKTMEAYGAVSAYIALNPVKAKIAKDPTTWRWSSFAEACSGSGGIAERCREGYRRMFGVEWKEAKAKMERLMSDRLPEDMIKEEEEMPQKPLRVTQAIWMKVRAFTQGAFITRNQSFVNRSLSQMTRGFNHEVTWSVEYFSRLDWSRVA